MFNAVVKKCLTKSSLCLIGIPWCNCLNKLNDSYWSVHRNQRRGHCI